MSRTISRRLLAQSPFAVFTEAPQASRLPLRCLRPFSITPRRKAEGDEAPPKTSPSPFPTAESSIPRRPNKAAPISPSLHPKADTPSNAPSNEAMANLATSMLSKMIEQNETGRNRSRTRFNPMASSDGSLISSQAEREADPHHFHIYATRHNTHITVTRPDRTPLISVSAGNLGFRKAGRKHYDSAFQLASYVLGRMKESGMNAEIKKMEVVLRGFGSGREAVTKALLGSEGRFLRGKVIKVADATRLKFGGTRSKKPRRLG